jgi:tetratricopeptide (TPR) repeat protein
LRLRPGQRTLLAALTVALCLLSPADARQGGDCGAPDELAARAETLSAKWKSSELREALNGFERARVCWGRAGLRREEAGALKRIGDIQFLFGKYPQAIDAYGAALANSRDAGDRQAEAHARINLGRAMLLIRRPDEALQNAQEAASIARTLGDRGLEAAAENVIGKYHYARGEYLEAPRHYEQALSLARAAGDPAEEAQALYGVGQVHSDIGELSEALAYYERALPLWRSANRRPDEVMTVSSMGLVYSLMGESQTALEHLEGTVLPFMREAGVRKGEAAAHNNIGYVYQTLGDYEAALSHYREALAIFDEIELPGGQVNTSILVGDISALFGRTREAQAYYERGLALGKPLGNRQQEAEILNSMGSLRLSERNAKEAYKLFRQALSVYEEVNYLRGQAAALNNIGWYFGGRGDWRTASEHFKRALAFCRTARDRPGESLTLYNLARSNLETGDAPSARQHVEDGLRIAESWRTKIAGGDLRASHFATAHRQFELYVAVLMKLYERDRDPALIAAAFEASERGRARSLLELLAEYRADIRRGVEPALLRRERELQFRLNSTVERRIQLLGARADVKDVAEVERQIDELTGEYRRVQGQIRTASPHYASLVQPTPLTLRQTQQGVLDADTILLEYALGDERSFVWASASVLALARQEMGGRRPAPKPVAVLADPIFDGNDERLAQAKGGVRRRGGRPSVEVEGERSNADVSQRALRSFDRLDGGAVIARLAFSRREAKAIMASAPARGGLLALDFRASRETATGPELSQYRIVHFATHGLLDSEHPELSGVILSLFDEHGRRQDGFLELNEIYNLNLPAELVVLSACQTALGKDVRGEELVGLTRGFMYAGARRVVASLWKVDDSATAELMGQFYREMLGKGARPAEALRAAQLHMWRQPRWRSPYFWAAFTLQGEWR